jgi:hypothetical protein
MWVAAILDWKGLIVINWKQIVHVVIPTTVLICYDVQSTDMLRCTVNKTFSLIKFFIRTTCLSVTVRFEVLAVVLPTLPFIWDAILHCQVSST